MNNNEIKIKHKNENLYRENHITNSQLQNIAILQI